MPCLHKPYRTLRGEGAAQLTPMPSASPVPVAGDSFSTAGRYMGMHNFSIEQLLGEGNYSQVYSATLRATQERYAFKVVDKQKVKRYKKQHEVLIEKWVLSNVHHPSMIKLFQTFQDQGALYLVLEHVPGGELWAQSHRRGLPLRVATFYAAELLEVVQHLHEHGVVHRDIKPENVLLTKHMHLKLIDFGTAKVFNPPADLIPEEPVDADQRRGRFDGKFKEFVGTPEYMAPEAINNKPADFRSDLWSFGCFIVQLVTGWPPFKGGSDYLTFKRVIHRKFQLPESTPPHVADLFSRLCVHAPKERLGGAVEIDEPADGRHNMLRRHPFFSALEAQGALWKGNLSQAPIPMESLQEMCVPLGCDQLTKHRGDIGVLRAPPLSTWAEGVKRQVGFELHKREALDDGMRSLLGLPPGPAPITDEEILAIPDDKPDEEPAQTPERGEPETHAEQATHEAVGGCRGTKDETEEGHLV